MNGASTGTIAAVESRPTGVIRPTHERAVRAMAALNAGRVPDAEAHIAAISEGSMVDRAWKSLLSALVAVRQAAFPDADRRLHQAVTLALVAGTGTEETTEDADAMRLAAGALLHLGRLYRRQDRAEDARVVHRAARRLVERHGSWDELWETAVELGLDAEIARRHDDAQRWYRMAIETAERSSEAPARKRAVAWTHLSTSLTEDARHEDAVTAARAARDWWRKHDIGAAETARADLTLGSALLRQGESLHGQDDKPARSVLADAIQWLATAREALLAFGPEQAADTQLCIEQQDFAERLIASLADL